jgi:hypothetical protein
MKLFLESFSFRAKIHHFRPHSSFRFSQDPIHHDPGLGRNVVKGDDAHALSRNGDHLPIQIFFAAFQLAPDLWKNVEFF